MEFDQYVKQNIKQTAKKETPGGFARHLAQIDKQSLEARALMLHMLEHDFSEDKWRGLMVVPEKSMIDGVLKAFHKETDIPLELPFFTMLHFISGYLLSKKVKFKGTTGEFYPEMWFMVLAESGAGKTLTHDIIAEHSPVKSEFPEPASGAKFIDSLQHHNYGLWFQDEIAPMMRQIDTPRGQMSGIKSYMLRMYTNSKIGRHTKDESITIEEPCLGILGLNTPESFFDSIRPASLLDGFAQRFSYVVAQPDPARNVYDDPEKYANFNSEKIGRAVKAAFVKLEAMKIHPRYKVSKQAEDAYKVAFATLISKSIPISFFRRVMFKSYKYAVLYHIILGKETDMIDAEDVGWGARVASLHLQDLKYLVNRDEMKGIGMMVATAKKHQAASAAKGEKFGSRELTQKMRDPDGKKFNKETSKTLFSLL